MAGATKKTTRKAKSAANKKLYAEVRTKEVARSPQPTVEGEIVINGVGRPSKFTQAIADRFCAGISSGYSMRTVCKPDDMPAIQTIYNWFSKYPKFLEQYAHATQERAEAMHEDILDIADDGSNDWMEIHRGDWTGWVTNGEALQRSRLRVETRKWLMEKMKPKKYGAKLDLTTDGKELPTPILGLTETADVHSNNSNKENS